jgi:tetratricopeptide (TPR) repeat protein
VLSRIDGTSKAAEVVELVGLPKDDVLKSLLALLCAGLIRRLAPRKPARWPPPPPPVPPPGKPPAAPSARPPAAPPPAAVAEPAAVARAADTPAVPPLDAEAEAREAESSLSNAEKLLTDGKYWDAIQVLEALIPRIPTRMGRRAQLALARAYRKNPKWAKSAEDLLLTVTQAEPGSVEALLELANLYEEKGLKSRAVSMYRKVLELDGAHAEARAALRRLEPEAGGLTGKFKKIIGRE